MSGNKAAQESNASSGAPRPSLPLAPGPAPRRLARQALETCGKDDQFHDYVLQRYSPVAPFEGALRSINLLVESFALAEVEREGLALVDALRRGLGPFRTVWGIKHTPWEGIRGWELYFYDPERKHSDLSLARVREILEPVVTVDAEEPRPLPWHMFSVEITVDALKQRVPVPADMYLDMRSYKLQGRNMAFENIYSFHEPQKEIDHILHRLRGCPHFDLERDSLGTLMPVELFRCHRMCVANKRRADALYFSRVTTTSALRFLRDHRWPEPLIGFFDSHSRNMSHLLWDVGIDFRKGPDGPQVGKSSIYGSF